MLKSYAIKALVKGEKKPREGVITVSNIEIVKNAFKRYGHLIMDATPIETDVNVLAKKLPLYVEV